jgi:hypothetical protein
MYVNIDIIVAKKERLYFFSGVNRAIPDEAIW